MPGKSQKTVKHFFNKMQLLHYKNTNGITLQSERNMPELKLKKIQRNSTENELAVLKRPN